MAGREIINVGLIGHGNVGAEVAKKLLDSEFAENHGINLKSVAVRDTFRADRSILPELTTDAPSIINDPNIQIIIELMGGTSLAPTLMLDAMDKGKSVITANKAAIGEFMPELFSAANSRGVDFAFEASVGGSIRIIHAIRTFGGERIRRIMGIINGTTNYMLTRMSEEGLDYDSALKEAQQLGYAEADPTFDVEGHDAASKLAILASLAYNTRVRPERIAVAGITQIGPVDIKFAKWYSDDDHRRGYSIKLLAIADYKESGLELSVAPTMISNNHDLASVNGATNAITIEGELSKAQTFKGEGAGGEPTAGAVIADLLDVVRNIRGGTYTPLPTLDSPTRYVDSGDVEEKGYVRVNQRDIPGTSGSIYTIIGNNGLNIGDTLQRRRQRFEVNGKLFTPDIITIDPAPRRVIDDAITEIAKNALVYGTPVFVRIID